MKKQFAVVLSVAVATFLLSVLPAAAQGRAAGQGHGTAAAGAAGAHEPMGMESAMGNHGNAAGADTSSAKGPKTPDELLMQNTKLSGNLLNLLPTGTTAQDACANFKNLGQCVAAIHVSHNLGIDFNSLACDMTLKPVASTSTTTTTTSCPAGTGTGTKGMSLGASVQALDPTLTKSDVSGATKAAEHQAQADMSRS